MPRVFEIDADLPPGFSATLPPPPPLDVPLLCDAFGIVKRESANCVEMPRGARARLMKMRETREGSPSPPRRRRLTIGSLLNVTPF